VIGPGWMPSRPRPLGRVRRGIASYAPYLRRGRRARAAAPVPVPVPVPGSSAAPGSSADPAPVRDELAGPFADRKAKLPVATLLPRRTDGRPAVITGALQRWIEQRWMWVRPRAIPLFVAFMGLVGVLNARRYLISLARGDEPAIAAHGSNEANAPGTPDLPAAIHETARH
jgi:hypothetical protein